MPQMPTPDDEQIGDGDTVSSMTSANEIGKADDPPLRRALRLSTIALILSVTEAKSYPGPRIGAVAHSAAASLSARAICHMSFRSRLPAAFSISGFGLRNLRQIRGSGPRVQFFEQLVIPVLAFSLETRLFGSLMFPNTIASDGHDCWHAVTISPSRTERSCFSASIFTALIRCTQ